MPRTTKGKGALPRPKARRSPRPPEADQAALAALVARLTGTCETLAQALHESPKAADFQPLADHLYEFAQAAPRLLESLHELSQGLGAVRSSFDDALVRMPRPEEYEPLAEPLRRFARTSPELVEVVEELRAAMAALPRASACPPPGARSRLEQAMAELDLARRSIEDALGTLPSDPEYAAVARQLRELATVSPSLMEWLKQVPRVSTPLAASAKGLQEAATALRATRDRLADVVQDLWPDD